MENHDIVGPISVAITISILLTIILNSVLLKLYRKLVLKSMNKKSPEQVVVIPDFKKDVTESFSIHDQTAEFKKGVNVEWNFQQINNSLTKASLPYIIGGIFYSLVLTFAWMQSANKNLNFVLSQFLILFICYYWPVIITMKLINVRFLKKFTIIYFILYLIFSINAFFHSIDSSKGYFVFFQWLLINLPPTLFLMILLYRRFRAISPLVFVFILTVMTGATLLINSFGNNEGLIKGASVIGSEIGLGAYQIILIIIFIGIALFAPIGWLLLRWIGRRYRNKKMSDLSLNLDTLWFMFGFFHSFTLLFENTIYIFTSVVAFVLFKSTASLTRLVVEKNSKTHPEHKILLLLRVFSLGRKSERLFDSISNLWLRNGSICMISGPDLATSTVEPHEFYNFIGGKLSRLFIHNERELHKKISEIDLLPDPDGRHRVNEFFCIADTWQQTMKRLVNVSNGVLMDLRSFSNNNAGCIFELEYLLNSVPFNKIVLLTDKTTNRSFLDNTINSIFNASNKSNLKKNELNIFEFGQNDKLEVQNLIELLLKRNR